MSPNELRDKIERSEPPLKYVLEEAEVDGAKIFRGSLKRGLLSLPLEEQQAELGFPKQDRSPAEIKFQSLARKLRRELRMVRYPIDVERIWVRVPGGEWRRPPIQDGDLAGQAYETRNWHDHLVAVTEPLSRHRIIGDLLHRIDHLLSRDLDPLSLDLCWDLMNAYSRFYISGNVNRLAIRGMKVGDCLARGPKIRKERGTVVLEVVCKHAENCWTHKAALRGNKTSTAEEIAPEVNQELKSLSRKPLRPKTIADAITKGISGGLLRTG